MSSNEKPAQTRSDPIPIATRNRSRSLSVSSASSDSASSSSPNPQTPPSVTVKIPSPSTSPILSYFLAQSPTKAQSPTTGKTPTFPLKRKFGTAPVFEVDEERDKEIPVAAHARRASATVANRFSQTPTMPFSDQRGTNVLRRLSLSSAAFVKPPLDTATQLPPPPSPPPNTAVSPTPRTAPFTNKPHRSATISTDGGRPRRVPSPMGERILKGHFDGFN